VAKRMRRVSALAGLAFATLAYGLGGPLASEESGTAGQPMIGSSAPPFALRSVAGTTLGLSELRGRYAVIHFGASW